MTTHVSLTRLGIQEWHQGIPSASLTPATDRSLPLAPPKSWAWTIDSDGTHIGPQTLGRPAALREATDATVTGRLQGNRSPARIKVGQTRSPGAAIKTVSFQDRTT